MLIRNLFILLLLHVVDSEENVGSCSSTKSVITDLVNTNDCLSDAIETFTNSITPIEEILVEEDRKSKKPHSPKTLTIKSHYTIDLLDTATTISDRVGDSSISTIDNTYNVSNSSIIQSSLIPNNSEEDYQLDSNTEFLSFEEWKKQKGVEEKENEEAPLRTNQPMSPKDNGEIGEDMEIDLTNFFSTEEEEGSEVKYNSFNYASFDCAATIVKTNQEAKGVTSILFENKDSYLLNPCSAPNKYIIIELCQDILVDSFVLANLEYFSSTFKKISISVSESYPVQKNGWINLGSFTAEDIKDYQTFKIENPRIWTKYVKFEFLEHYGNEFYCPLTVVRVHGRTMIQEYKQEENLQKNKKEETVEIETEDYKELINNNGFQNAENLSEICQKDSKQDCTEEVKELNLTKIDFSSSILNETTECSLLPTLKFDELFKNNKCLVKQNSTSSSSSSISSTSNSGSGTQESIYKNIMKRLSLLESNATLSVLYIEEQSKLLSKAFTNLEKKHSNNLNKLISTFNNTINEQIGSLTNLYGLLQQETRLILNSQRLNHEVLLSDAYSTINQLQDDLKFQKIIGFINFTLMTVILIYVALTRDTVIDTFDEKFVSTSSKIRANIKRYYSYGSSTPTSPTSPTLSGSEEDLKLKTDQDIEYEQPPTPAYSDGEE